MARSTQTALQFQLLQSTTVPLELEGVTPDALVNQSCDDVRRAPIYHGNQQCELGEFFKVTGRNDGTWRFEGDCSSVHWLGTGMTAGEIIVDGPIGRHCGSAMSGGTIEVHGNAGDWLAAEMHGGSIRIHGSAGDHVGSSYPGSPRGVTRGMILVHGDAGDEIGKSMRRGVIAVGGSCGDLLAVGMLAGTIVVLGKVGRRCAAAMRRGTVILTDTDPPEFLPTIQRATSCQPLVLQLIFHQLREAGFPITKQVRDAWYDMYHADLLEGGRGEIFVRKQAIQATLAKGG